MIATGITALALLAAPQTEVGEWLVAPASVESCAAVREFAPGLMLSIRSNVDGAGELVVSDERWRLDSGVQAGALSWDSGQSSEPADFTARRIASGRWVLGLPIEAGFVAKLVVAKRLAIRIPEIDFAQEFDIADADVMAQGLSDCTDNLP